MLRPVRVPMPHLARRSVVTPPWLRPWEPSNPETPLHRSLRPSGPYVGMVRTMRHEARQGLRRCLGGDLRQPVRRPVHRWLDRNRSLCLWVEIGYWIDEAYAGRITPTALAMAVDCFRVVASTGSKRRSGRRTRRRAERRATGFREEGTRSAAAHRRCARRCTHIPSRYSTAEEVLIGMLLCCAATVDSVKVGGITVDRRLNSATPRGSSSSTVSAFTLRQCTQPRCRDESGEARTR